MRTLTILTAIVLVAPAFSATQRVRHPYRREWAHHLASKQALGTVAAGAALQQARHSPHEWGGGVEGFGKRVASGFGKHVVKTSVEYTVAGIRHEDLHYYPSQKRGFRPRLEHALVSTVVTRKTTTGRKTVASGRISGAVASGFVSRLWQPASLQTASSGAASAGISLGADAGANVVREFWPEIRHPKAAHHRAEVLAHRRSEHLHRS